MAPGFRALLDMLASGLRNMDTVKVGKLPRMADSLKWITACGHTDFAFEYERNIEEAMSIGLEASPVAGSVIALLRESGGAWEGTMMGLLTDLRLFDADLQRRPGFPKTPRGLAGLLKRDAPALRREGIEYTAPEKLAHKRIASLKVVQPH